MGGNIWLYNEFITTNQGIQNKTALQRYYEYRSNDTVSHDM